MNSPRAGGWRSTVGSGARGLLLVGTGIALAWTYLTHGIVGGGDAQFYTNVVSDFVLQVRAGVFPVWAGQTEYSLFGGVFPLRYAPFLQYFAALVDLLTCHSLPPFQVLNVSLALCLVGALLSCYFCLVRVIPLQRWLAAGLSALYVCCPGVIGLGYAQDLYMSTACLPFPPLVFLGIVRSFERNDAPSRMLMAGGLAGAWLSHPPIAMWTGLVAVIAQIPRIMRHGWSRRDLHLDGMAVGTFFVLAAYSFTAVGDLRAQVHHAPVQVEDLLAQVRAAFPGNWLPLPRMIMLENLQAGYSLVALACWSIVRIASGARHPLGCSLLAAGATLLTLTIPVPILTEALWRALPGAALTINNIWPTQRLQVVFALCTVFGAALLGRESPGALRRFDWFAMIFFALTLSWSTLQAGRLIVHVRQHAATLSATEVRQRPENLTVLNSAGGLRMTPPRYASGGVMDPELEHHFLDPTTGEIRGAVTDTLFPGFGPGPKTPGALLSSVFTGTINANPGIVDLQPTLTLQPNRRYLLALQFRDLDYTGLLILEGRDFHRQYLLPHSGESRAFGSGPESSHLIPLWTSQDVPVEVRLQFVPTGGKHVPRDYIPFARFELQAYERDHLPVRMTSILPYRSIVHTETPALLETFRLHLPGYRATVDGEPTPVKASADGYVTIPLRPGTHHVALDYHAPPLLLLSFWLSAVAWIVWLVMLMRPRLFLGWGASQPKASG